MNRVFKTKWSAAHQQYVVTDEHRATKGKASKSAVALTVGWPVRMQLTWNPALRRLATMRLIRPSSPGKPRNIKRTGVWLP